MEKKNKKKNRFNRTLNYDLNPQEPENADLNFQSPGLYSQVMKGPMSKHNDLEKGSKLQWSREL